MSRVNLRHSRRNMHNYCPFWLRDERGVGNAEEYIYNRVPSGFFYAKETEAESDNNTVLFGSFMADSHRVMLESVDDLNDLTENAIVKYKNEIWRVESLQKRMIIKETQFSSIPSYHWYIQLMR